MKPLRISLGVIGLVLGHLGPAADVTLDLTFGWQKQSLSVPSSNVINDHGQSLRFTRISGLISEVAFIRDDGSSVQIPGGFGYFDAESDRNEVHLSGVPEGDYVGLQIRIGVPPDTNHADPATFPAGHPLNPLVNGLHWGWTGGYVFLAVEGKFGESADGLDNGFSFHIATDDLAKLVRFNEPFTVAPATRVALLFDLADWMKSESLSSSAGTTSTHSRTGDELALRLAERTATSFWFGQAVPGPTTLVFADQDGSSRSGPAPLKFEVPAGWPQPELPSDNLPTAPGVALGERLFHDPRLSGNETQSCVDCHRPETGFADDLAFSLGISGDLGTRNSMPLLNLAWNPDFAWDGSQPRIRDQAIAAMTNPIEMAGDPEIVVAHLEQDPELSEAFAAAFGDGAVTVDRIGRALEQFLLTLVSADSKFDRAMRGEVQLTQLETRGLELFNSEFDPRQRQFGADCFHCHGGSLFSDFAAKNNGLDLVSEDAGRAGVTGSMSDHGKFKTPSLRNIALTAPYMHDGRFETLEEVIRHYVSGVARADQLDPNLAKHPGRGVPLSRSDQDALVAFLRTLTDPALVTHDQSTQFASSP